MRIFATGATGYLGYHFVKEAVRQGHEVLCLKRSSSKSLFEPAEERAIQWVVNDHKMVDVVSRFQPDVLFHAAWGGVRGNDRDNRDIQAQNIKMSDELYKLYPYKQIISIGSQAEYGYYDNVVNEDHNLNPTIEYAKSKVISCQHLKDYCEHIGIEWQWIRIFTVFGEKQTGGLIKISADKIFNGATDFPTTKGEQKYSYLYVLDFAKSICNMLGRTGKSGIYNLSQPSGVFSNREVLEKIKSITKSDIQLKFGAIPYSDGQVMYMDGNVEKFEKAFGKIPYTDFDSALSITIDSFKQ